MLQFLVVFFGVFVSVISLNGFNGLDYRYDSMQTQEVKFFVDRLFQQHYYSSSFCKKEQQMCNAQNVTDVRNYLPAVISEGTLQKNIFTCYGKRNHTRTIVTGINSDFIDGFYDALAHEARLFMINHNTDVMGITLITDKNQSPDVDFCINRKESKGDNVFMLSTSYVEETD